MSKFRKKFDCFPIIGASTLNFISEEAQVYLLSIVSYFDRISSTLYVPRNALEPSLAVLSEAAIMLILILIAGAKVASSAIQSIMVYVIHLYLGIIDAKDFPVHQDCASFSARDEYVSTGVKAVTRGIPLRIPSVLRKSFVVFLVYDSNLTEVQRYFAVC